MATAAFLTRDSYLGEISRPLTLNRYGYCLGNPVCYVDPSGHWIYEEELIKIYGEYGKMSAKAAQDALLRKDVNLPSFTQMTRFLSALHEVGSPDATVGYVAQYDYTKGGQYVHEVEQMAEQRNQGYACETRKEWVTLEMMNSDKNHTWKVKEIETYDLVTGLPEYKEVRPMAQTDVDEINRVLNKYEINTPKWIAHFLAQCDIESDLGEGPVERYDKGTNIFEFFKKYEKEGNHLGNTEPGDGTRYRGGGAMHLTGKEKYEKFGEYIGDDQIFTDGALYVGQNYFWESAGYFWKVYSQMDEKYDENVSVLKITKIVKGSLDLYEKREDAYNFYLKMVDYLKKALIYGHTSRISS